jgi:hypothetical protein
MISFLRIINNELFQVIMVLVSLIIWLEIRFLTHVDVKVLIDNSSLLLYMFIFIFN